MHIIQHHSCASVLTSGVFNTVPLLALFHDHFSSQSHSNSSYSHVPLNRGQPSVCLEFVIGWAAIIWSTRSVPSLYVSLIHANVFHQTEAESQRCGRLMPSACFGLYSQPAAIWSHHTRAEQSISQTEWSRLQLAETGTAICAHRANSW